MLCSFSTIVNAQRNCGSTAYLEYQKEIDPKRAQKMRAIENHAKQFAANRSSTDLVTIPVVVHVVYNSGAQNISDAQILSQMTVLDDDFRRTNSDANGTWSQAADTNIEFCLASIDPNGNPTTGITRTQTTVNGFGTNDNVKFASSGGVDAWPASDYLNIWVCNIGGGILGYAQFPGGNPATDGIVNDYRYFGTIGTATSPFDLGRTCTHEVGHYLNLRHIWGDGNCNADDFVSDTPTSDAPNYGCATGHVSCNTTDMVENYMDYSDDGCMNLFTEGQATRMCALFAPGGARFSLTNSAACGTPPTPTCTDGIQNGDEEGVDCGGSCPNACPPPPVCTTVNITINLDNYPEETSWTITSAGGTVASGGTYGNQPDGSTVVETACLEDGCYDFTIFDTYGDGICCGFGNGSYSVSVDGTIVASGGSFNSSETTNFCIEEEATPTCTDGIQNGDEEGVDCGGSCPNACPPTGCSTVTVDTNNFDTGWGIWNDGGSDARRSNRDATYANSGSYCIRLRDNTSTSVMTTDNLNLSSFEDITVDFTYIARSMDNSNEDFWLQVSTDGGGSYTTVEEWNTNDEFTNLVREFDAVTIDGPFSSTTRLRFRCDASGNSDWVYIDDVTITGCANNNRSIEPIHASEVITTNAAEIKVVAVESISNMKLFPNPTRDELNIAFEIAVPGQVQLMITNFTGKVLQNQMMEVNTGQQETSIDASRMIPGFYLVHLIANDKTYSKKFVVIE